MLICLLAESVITEKFDTDSEGNPHYSAIIESNGSISRAFKVDLVEFDSQFQSKSFTCYMNYLPRFTLTTECRTVPQYQESSATFPSAIPCSEFPDASVCVTAGTSTTIFTLREIETVRICKISPFNSAKAEYATTTDTAHAPTSKDAHGTAQNEHSSTTDAAKTNAVPQQPTQAENELDAPDKPKAGPFPAHGSTEAEIEVVCGAVRKIMIPAASWIKNENLNVSFTLGLAPDATAYYYAVIRGNTIMGLPDQLVEKAELDVESYVKQRKANPEAPLHTFSTLGRANPDFFADLIDNYINPKCTVSQIGETTVDFVCTNMHMYSLIELNVKGNVTEFDPPQVSSSAVQMFNCSQAYNFREQRAEVKCEFSLNGLYRVQENITALAGATSGAVLSQFEFDKFISENDKHWFEMEFEIQDLPVVVHGLGQIFNVPEGVRHANWTFTSAYCPSFYNRINETHCFSGCYNDTVFESGICKREKCPIDFIFYENEFRCVSFDEYYDLTGISLPTERELMQEYVCGEHGVKRETGFLCDCEVGFEMIDYVNKVMCTEEPELTYPKIPEMSLVELLASFFDGQGMYDFSAWGAIGKFFGDLKQVFQSSVIMNMLIATGVTACLALFLKFLR